MVQNKNLNKCDIASHTFSVLPHRNDIKIMEKEKVKIVSSTRNHSYNTATTKSMSPSKLSCRSRSENDIKVNYLKLPKKSLGPYHDKHYHSFGRRHNLPKYSMEEISKHNTKESCWIIVDNLVLDVTPFLPYHPAAAKCIIKNGGKICDRHFKFHSKKAQQLFWKFVIGRVESEGTECIIQ